MSVSQAQAEALRARGYRAESTLLDGPRIVLDLPEDGVYITIVPGDTVDLFHWNIWRADDGHYIAGGADFDPVAAAQAADHYIDTEWR